MAADIKGTAVVWSMGGITFTAGIVSATSPSLPQSMKYSRNAENAKIKDVGGDIVTMILHGGTKTLSINVIPSSTSIAAAFTSKEAHVIAPGTKVTIADASGAAAIETNWIVTSSAENRSVDGVVTVDLELENAAQADISTSAS